MQEISKIQLKPILPRSFYNRDTPEVAQDLIGKCIVRKIHGHILVAIIAETEAYRSDDPASHAFIGKNERNKALFGEVGHVYVYFSYGIHYCMNIVARDTKKYEAGGILIRAIVPIEGQEFMAKRRGRVERVIDGPGKVTQALQVNFDQLGVDVADPKSEIFITEGIRVESSEILTTTRIGISKAKEWLWRFRLKIR